MAQGEELSLPFTWDVQGSGNIETFEQSFEEQVISWGLSMGQRLC